MKFFILLFSTIILSCSVKKYDCFDFKTGTFKYQNSKYSNWIITRNDSVQIEYDKKNNATIVDRVKWVSDCQYILITEKTTNYEYNSEASNKVNIDIIQISKNKYKYRAFNDSLYIEDWLIKIE